MHLLRPLKQQHTPIHYTNTVNLHLLNRPYRGVHAMVVAKHLNLISPLARGSATGALIGRQGLTTILWCTSTAQAHTTVIVLCQGTTHIQPYSVDQSESRLWSPTTRRTRVDLCTAARARFGRISATCSSSTFSQADTRTHVSYEQTV